MLLVQFLCVCLLLEGVLLRMSHVKWKTKETTHSLGVLETTPYLVAGINGCATSFG